MERRVKERLIGACILVTLVVAVVPELLSGPKPATPGADASAADTLRLPAGAPDPVRNVTVDLATSKPALAEAATTTVVQPSAGAGAASAPSGPPTVVDASNADGVVAPAGGTSSSAGPVNATSAGPESVHAASARPLETPAPVTTSGQTFAVQLGSFANRSNAENLVHQLKAQGFAIYINTEGSGSGARYRVRVGPLADRDATDRVISKLKAMGHAATIVSPR